MKCNTPIDPDTKLALQGDALEIALKDPLSPRCGQELSDDDTFCPSCGAKVSVRTEIQDETALATNQDKSNKEVAPIIYSSKRRDTYALLAFFFGGLGVHNVYAERYKFAIAQLILTTLYVTIKNVFIPFHIATLNILEAILNFTGLDIDSRMGMLSIVMYAFWIQIFPMSIWPIMEMLIVGKDGKGFPFIKPKTITPFPLQLIGFSFAAVSRILSNMRFWGLFGWLVAIPWILLSVVGIDIGIKEIKRNRTKKAIFTLSIVILTILLSILAIFKSARQWHQCEKKQGELCNEFDND